MLKREQQSIDLDWCIVQAVKLKRIEHIRALVDGGASVQIGLAETVRAALSNPKTRNAAHFHIHTDILRIFLDHGACVYDAEIDSMARALELSDGDFPEESKRAMELFSDELATGQANI